MRFLAIGIGSVLFFLVVRFLMSNHAKRFILISSLQRQLEETSVFEKQTMGHINEILKLAGSEDALLLPAKLYRQLWDTEAVRKIVNENWEIGQSDVCQQLVVAQLVASRLMDITPKWMRYPEKDMTKDLVDLLSCQSLAHTA